MDPAILVTPGRRLGSLFHVHPIASRIEDEGRALRERTKGDDDK
jgi:hypothetical protein